ncbi:MAG TPA: ABC transporter permease [Anaerolineales bacterium]|nr:ABC transporter permease [Anaerolineales bacterium]
MELTPAGFQYRVIDPKERLQIKLRSAAQRAWQAWRVFFGNKLALLGLALLSTYLLMAAVYPLLLGNVWPKGIYNPVTGHDVDIFPHPSPPSSRHLLGTDTLGRDVLSMLMAATKPSLQMAFTAALLAAISGTLVAAFSAYFRGFIDTIFSHLADLTMLAPAPILMVVIGFMWDIDPFEFGVIYGMLVGIGAVSVVLRAYAISVLNRTFIQAAKVAGGGSFHIIFRHLIPHMLPLAAVNMLLTVTGAIFANGFIAFLGLSRAQLNWGSMIYDSFTYQIINGKITWNVLIPAALAISFFAASFYLIALGLQDVVDPRLAQKREQTEYSARNLRN